MFWTFLLTNLQRVREILVDSFIAYGCLAALMNKACVAWKHATYLLATCPRAFCAQSDVAYTHLVACLSPDLKSPVSSPCTNPPRKSYKAVLLSGFLLSISVASLCFPLSLLGHLGEEIQQLALYFSGGYFKREIGGWGEISGCCIYAF